jgi:hypothetical protein
MPTLLVQKLLEMEEGKLLDILMKFKMQNNDAFEELREIVEDME